ncbi:MAG: prenyltransferase [Candidatus Firestonebacteria bacterium]
MKKIKYFLIETRAPFLTVTIFPVLLGTFIAFRRNGVFSLLNFALMFFTAVFLHLGTNVINDYFDNESGTDNINKEFASPFTGGSRMIQLGFLASKEVLIEGLILFVLGLGFGLFTAWRLHSVMFLSGVIIGFISGFFYTAPFFNWAGKGLGELLAGVNFGIIFTAGGYFVQTGTITPEVVMASLPLAVLASLILLINEFQDYNADKQVGKKNLVVRWGRKPASEIYKYALILCYPIVCLNIWLGCYNISSTLVFLSLPLAVKAISISGRYYDNPKELTPANKLTILCFNIFGFIIPLSYLFKF